MSSVKRLVKKINKLRLTRVSNSVLPQLRIQCSESDSHAPPEILGTRVDGICGCLT